MKRRISTLLIAASLSLLPYALFAAENQVAECSLCETSCYTSYSHNLEDCGWRWWCADVATSEKNACLGNCAIDVC
jgi:hypothetical protein